MANLGLELGTVALECMLLSAAPYCLSFVPTEMWSRLSSSEKHPVSSEGRFHYKTLCPMYSFIKICGCPDKRIHRGMTLVGSPYTEAGPGWRTLVQVVNLEMIPGSRSEGVGRWDKEGRKGNKESIKFAVGNWVLILWESSEVSQKICHKTVPFRAGESWVFIHQQYPLLV